MERTHDWATSRRVRFVTPILICLAVVPIVAGCGKSSPTQEGYVMGTATACSQGTEYAYRMTPVRVTLGTGSSAVAHESGYGTITYRFGESPGSYRLSSDQGGTTPVRVAVHAGKTARVDMYANCPTPLQ
jgi:hypothetical protein